MPGMKHSSKNTEKTASTGKKMKENGFHEQENVFLLKLVLLNFNNGFHHQRKGSEQKHNVSSRQEISSSSRNEGFV